MKTLDDKLNEITALCNKATEGPWDVDETTGMLTITCEGGNKVPIGQTFDNPGEDEGLDNLQFIGAARTLVPRLIAALQKCREQRDDTYALADLHRLAQARRIEADETELLKLLTKE